MKAKILTTTTIKPEWLEEIKQYIPAVEFDIQPTKQKLQTYSNPNTGTNYAVWSHLRSLFDNGKYRYRVYVMSDEERIAYGMSDHYAAYNVRDNDGVLDFYMSIGDISPRTEHNGFKYNFTRRFIHEALHGKEQEMGRVYLGTPSDRTHVWEREGRLKELLQEHFTIKELQTKVGLLQRILELTKTLFLKTPQIEHPLPGFRITQPYGVPNSVYTMSKHHIGTDYGTPVGTPVKMPCDGKIVASGTGASIGHFVTAEFTFKGVTYQVRFGHLRETQRKRDAKRGEVIAFSGNSGMSTGPHVHCDVWLGKVNLTGINQTNWRERTIDPEVLFKQ